MYLAHFFHFHFDVPVNSFCCVMDMSLCEVSQNNTLWPSLNHGRYSYCVVKIRESVEQLARLFNIFLFKLGVWW